MKRKYGDNDSTIEVPVIDLFFLTTAYISVMGSFHKLKAFKNLEDFIKNSSEELRAEVYCEYIIKIRNNRWEEFEPSIKKIKRFWDEYCSHFEIE